MIEAMPRVYHSRMEFDIFVELRQAREKLIRIHKSKTNDTKPVHRKIGAKTAGAKDQGQIKTLRREENPFSSR
jgi:hypothetical protein